MTIQINPNQFIVEIVKDNYYEGGYDIFQKIFIAEISLGGEIPFGEITFKEATAERLREIYRRLCKKDSILSKKEKIELWRMVNQIEGRWDWDAGMTKEKAEKSGFYDVMKGNYFSRFREC